MKVCACMDVRYDTVKQAVDNLGNDIDKISEETGAGTGCGCCLSDGCKKVELPLPSAITKALQE